MGVYKRPTERVFTTILFIHAEYPEALMRGRRNSVAPPRSATTNLSKKKTWMLLHSASPTELDRFFRCARQRQTMRDTTGVEALNRGLHMWKRDVCICVSLSVWWWYLGVRCAGFKLVRKRWQRQWLLSTPELFFVGPPALELRTRVFHLHYSSEPRRHVKSPLINYSFLPLKYSLSRAALLLIRK